MKKPKATWGKIKNWDKLSPEHRALLNEQLNPTYKKVTPRAVVAVPHDYFVQKNCTIASS